MTTESQTPRTDALWPCYTETDGEQFYQHARSLERELAAAASENARLREALIATRAALPSGAFDSVKCKQIIDATLAQVQS